MFSPDSMTTTGVARLYSSAEHEVMGWQVRRLFESGMLPEPDRIGGYRVIHRADLPKVEEALRRAGYLPALCPQP